MRRIFFTTLFAIALTAPAAAIDFKAPITSLDGSSVPLSKDDKTALTLGRACEEALTYNGQLAGDTATPEEKNRRFWIAMKIHEDKPLTADEITIVKKVVGLAYGPLIVGRAFELLDPASVPK